MRALYSVSLLALSCAALATSSVSAQTYSVTDLGVLPGNQLSMPNGLDEAGQVVGFNGYFFDGTVADVQAFLYEDGKMSPIGSAQQDFQANGITGDEEKGDWHRDDDRRKTRIVGSLAYLPSGAAQAYLYEDHSLRELGLLPGGHSSVGFAVNSSGEVAGVADDANYLSHPFLYRHGNMIALPTGGTLGGYASAINERGDVVGNVNVPGNYFIATLFRQGEAIPLGVLPGGFYSYATAINDWLQIAGTSNVPGLALTHAFLWEKGKLTDLGILPTGTMSASQGINNQGEVVGTADVTSATTGSAQHAFLYSHGQLHDLNNMIPTDSGWTLETAIGINNRGQIAGTGLINGNTRAFLLTPACRDGNIRH